MLTYTSAALVSLLFSFSPVSITKAADYTAELQPVTAPQTLKIALTRSPQPLSHRGSGRIYYRVMG